jgi:anhydro-N-acetylmuramic acid kinase
MNALTHYAEKAMRRVVGLSASLAGIDAVLLDISGSGASTRISLLCFRRTGYPVQTRDALVRATSPECPGIEICRLNFALGRLLADAAKQVVRSKGGSLDDVDLVGCGGLPLYHLIPQHDPDDRSRQTSVLQVGELAVIAEETGATTVGDFGASDIAAGGCGAPLMPFVDFVLFHHAAKTRAVQTIDRMASVTLVPAGDDPDAVVAFDTGPGHLVVDTITSVVSEGKLVCDHDGRLASLGQVSPQLLQHMMAHPFIRRAPPKSSSGVEFGSDFIGSVLDMAERFDITVEDLLATATAFTAESIAQSYREFLTPQHKIDEVILGGDGSYNAALRRMLRSRLPELPFYLHEDFGIYSEAKSAIASAILANETMLGHASNIRRATGAAHSRALGKIVPGADRT